MNRISKQIFGSRGFDPLTARKYERSIPVATFLGGFILATLTGLFSLENGNPIFCNEPNNEPNSLFCFFVICVGKGLPSSLSGLDYKEFLIGYMGLVGIFFIISVFIMKAAFVHQEKTGLTEFSHALYEWGFRGILVLLPIMVSPFSDIGIVMLVVAIILIFLNKIQDRIWDQRQFRRGLECE